MTISQTKPTITQRWDDPAMLSPAFRARVDMVMRRLTALDLDPVLHETFRSKERAAMLVKDGKVATLNVEGPGKFEVSDGATMLAQAR